MKSILKLLMLCLGLFVVSEAVGQSHKQKFSEENIKNMKIAFFTEKLNLTSTEAEKFWPVYNECQAEANRARRATMSAQRELQSAIKGESNKTEEEINTLVGKYYTCLEAENTLPRKHFTKYAKILPIKKAAQVKMLEDRFLHNLVWQYRGNTEIIIKSQKKENTQNKN